MSIFDDRMIEIRAQRTTATELVNTVAGDGTPGANPGGALGAVLIAGGIIGTIATAGVGWPLGAVAVVAGLLMIGGKQVVEQNIESMDTAAQESPEAVHKAAGIGLVKLLGYLIIAVAVLVGLVLALAMAGEIAGVTL